MEMYKVPVFSKGCVLTHEMLERMKEFAVELPSLQYVGYGDGILSGMEVSVSDHMLLIQPGIFVYRGELLFFLEEVQIPYVAKNVWQAVKVEVREAFHQDNFRKQEMEIVITEETEKHPAQIELARFRLQSGARLRSDHRDFKDLNTEYDTLNLIHAEWSSYERASVSPRLLFLFAKEAMEKGIQAPEDFQFVEQILLANGRTLNRTAVEFYIAKRLQRPMKQLTNEEIYQGLCEITKIFQGGVAAQPSRMNRDRRIIVD